MPLNSFAILVVLLMIFAVIYIEFASMPGKNARERGHPHADAISFLGWVGLLLGVAPWLIAMVWARTMPLGAQDDGQPESTGSANDREAS
jgi:hypothetical protein